MTRFALYARYSSDNQREASIDGQLCICREQAKREKCKIVGQDAQARQLDRVLAEAMRAITRSSRRLQSRSRCRYPAG